jgi:hypothetical protein
MALDTGTSPSGPSPLWIIALFIALSEVMAGVAAIATEGTSRLLFAYFAVGFPIIVLTVFVWLLLKHPLNLYSPAQFTETTSIQMFAQAFTQERRDHDEVVKTALIEEVVQAMETDAAQPVTAVRNSREGVAERIERRIDEASVTIDRHLFVEDAEPQQIPVTATTRVDSFLNTCYFSIAPRVRPFTYGQSWILADEKGEWIRDIGTRWAKEQGRESDTRRLTEVGISPGTKLLVVPIPDRR